MPSPFISVQDLIDYTGRGGTADPGMLIATDAACDTVRTVSGLTVNQIFGDQITLDGTGTDCLLLPEWPATVGTVTVNGGTVTDWKQGDRGQLFRTNGDGVNLTTLVWPASRQNIVVTYDHGWADQEIPRDIRMVALALATRLIVQGPNKQESIGQASVTYAVNATDLTDGELRILRNYKP